MEVRLSYRYDVTDPDPEAEELGMKLVADELRAMLANLQQAFADAGLDVEHFESTRRKADAGDEPGGDEAAYFFCGFRLKFPSPRHVRMQ